MSILCKVVTDDGGEVRTMTLQVLPREGEILSLETGDGSTEYRVRNIIHSESRGSTDPSVVIEATSQLM